LETSLSGQSTAPVLTTKNKETQHYIHLKPKKQTAKPVLADTKKPWFGTPFTTSGQVTEWPYLTNPELARSSEVYNDETKIS